MVGFLVLSAVAPAAAASTTQSQAKAYSGAHISFDVQSNAVVDYAVEGTTVFESVKVQSQESAQSSGLVGATASLSAVTSLEGAGLSLASQTQAKATISASGSSQAKMKAHDNTHGILVVSSNDQSQYVVANLSSAAEASQESDSQVSVSAGESTQGTFIVVGDGTVTVNENGDVTAKLGKNSKLVFRSYPSGKDSEDQKQERMISQGQVAGEVYVMTQEGGKKVVDTVTYTQQTTVEAKQSAENTVTVTAERTKEQGKIVITSVSKQAVGTLSDISVTVDGSAAAQVSSYSALKGAIGGDESAYMVKQTSSASANARADVLVAFNHFSERTAKISSSDSGGDSGGDSGSGASSPGFGVVAALVALVAIALYGRAQ
ncbi:PGF-CTERM sorting domain-containing protein [Halospeciosus flavus]|uniref:PGF-CTERM sorting domain-containing protein n=1 Tax=Halospeciosus flavus TaxID=3032283 RepID=A0ABD5Z5G9_9EURY|nr:PGF-CTERM sorting domain-containing protein [Halospeciosus flavus]